MDLVTSACTIPLLRRLENDVTLLPFNNEMVMSSDNENLEVAVMPVALAIQ